MRKGTQKPKSRSNRGRSGRSKDRTFDKKTSNVQDSETNDPVWYAQSPELLRDSSSIPFSWPVGTPMHQATFMENDVVSGICALKLTPTVGTANDANSPVNVASSAIYSFVRHANSGHSNYDATDLMIYLLAMSNVYSFITWCQRILGVIMAYDQRNRYIPDAILYADAVDASSIRNNIANFRFWLNNLINKVASFAVPGTMPLFQRLAFLYSNFYSDGPSIKDQIYLYSPDNCEFYQFGLDSQSKGQLTLTHPTFVNSLVTVANLMSYGDTLFNAIWAQEDFGIMSGDILKAYGDNIIKLSPVPEFYILNPIYDAMFLHQFKNAKCIASIDSSTLKVSDSGNGYLTQIVLLDGSAARVKTAMAFAKANKILSSDFEAPTPEVVIESTRLMPAWDSYNLWLECGTEIPRRFQLVFFDNTGAIQKFGIASDGSATSIDTYSQATFEAFVERVSRLRDFKYAPEIWLTELDSSSNVTKAYRVWDIDNYAVLDNDDLIKMHQAALMSMLAVPSIAKIQ